MQRITFPITFTLLILSLVLATSSCKHDQDVSPSTSSLACAGKNLRLQSLLFEITSTETGEKVEVDLVDQLPACAKDNNMRFETDGRLSGDEGSQVCPPDADDVDIINTSGSRWTYDPQTKTMTITDPSDPTATQTWQVKEVSSNGMTMTTSGTEDGITFKVTMVLKAA
jgi:hypothetical protein